MTTGSVARNGAPSLETVAHSGGSWARLEPVWRAVLEGTRNSSAFLSPRWIESWLESYGATLKPNALVWRSDSGEPVACALVTTRAGKLGPFPVTRTFLNASGGIDQPGCEHNDVLVVPEYREAVFDDLVALIQRSDTDELSLVGMSEDAVQTFQSRWPDDTLEGYFSEAPYVCLDSLRAAGTPYLSSLSSNTRAQIRRSLRRYEERSGPPNVDVASTEDELSMWFTELMALHQTRWEARGEPGVFSDPARCRFHRRLLARCFEADGPDHLSADILRIRFGGETIGYLYTLRWRGRVSYYQSGLRYTDDNRFKPGLVSHALAIEHYLAAGEREYDFLGGEPEAVRYKRSLSSATRMLGWVDLIAPNAKMRMLGGVRRARRRIRTALWADK